MSGGGIPMLESIEIDVTVLEGRNLVAKDMKLFSKKKGTSDPYVNFYVGGRKYTASSLEMIVQSLQKGRRRSTPLHVLCCDYQPPLDILADFLQFSPSSASIEDPNDGWLPLHCACASGAPPTVLELLCKADNQAGLLTVDHQGRTPLHILIIYRNHYYHHHQKLYKHGRRNRNTTSMVSESIIVTLAGPNGAAASICDYTNGMLPLHYACSSYYCPNITDIVRGILLADLEGLTARDNAGRTPLHIICHNCHQPSSTAIVSLMLSYRPHLVNIKSDNNNHPQQPNNNNTNTAADATYHRVSYASAVVSGKSKLLPLHLLNIRAMQITNPEHRQYARNCLCVILAKGQVNKTDVMEFYTALQELPDWLHDTAVTAPSVQTMLNHSISRRLPSAVLLLDLYCQIAVITSFSLAVIEKQSGSNHTITIPHEKPTSRVLLLAPLYFGGVYFLLREVAQMITMWAAGNFSKWMKDIANWFDVAYVTFVFLTALVWLDEDLSSKDNTAFVGWCVCGTFFIYLYLLSFLRSVFIEFAIFVNGFIHVMKRLVAFIVAMFLIIVCFMQTFFTLFQHTDECPRDKYDPIPEDSSNSSTTIGSFSNSGNDTDTLVLDEGLDSSIAASAMMMCSQYISNTSPHCNYWTSFLHVYTMLLGEVELEEFSTKGTLLTIFFVIFMFLVVILLANVLIALVVDSYGVIKNERAEIVFWANRLDFVAEMHTLRLAQCNSKLNGHALSDQQDTGNHTEYEGLTHSSSSSNNREDGYERMDPSSLDEDALEEIWKALIYIFDDDDGAIQNYDMLDMCTSIDYWLKTVMKLVTALVMIPLWILFGILSAGWFWPPQVRKWLFTQKSLKSPHTMSIHVDHDDVDVVVDDDQVFESFGLGSGEGQRRLHAHFQHIRKNTEEFHSEMNMAFCTRRDQIRHARKQMKGVRNEMMKEMKEIKQVMTMMFEQHTSSI